MSDKKHSSSRHSSTPPRAWFWLFFGIVLGFSLFTLSFVFIADHDKKLALESVEQQIANLRRPRQSTESEQDSALDLKKYQFYKSLTQLSQDILANESKPKVPQPAEEKIRHAREPVPSVESSKPPQQQTNQSKLILQVGAFRRQEEADRLRANLTLMGLPCYVQSAKVKDHIYHRVRLGPFQNQKELSKVQAKLRENHIESIAMTLLK